MKQAFTIDHSLFDKNLRALVTIAVPKHIEKAMWQAGTALKLDADNVIPKTPKKWGVLKRSGRVEKPKMVKKNWTVMVEYTAPYAARLHENEGNVIKNWSEPGSGAKFLQLKLEMFSRKYYTIIGNVLRGLFK